MSISRINVFANKIESAEERIEVRQHLKDQPSLNSHCLKQSISVKWNDPVLIDYFGCDESTLRIKLEIIFSEYVSLVDEDIEEKFKRKLAAEPSEIYTYLKNIPISDEAIELSFAFYVSIAPEKYKNMRSALLHNRLSSAKILLSFDPVGWFDEIDNNTNFSVEEFHIIMNLSK